ncbi:site-2 protease family protein [Anaerotignum lactatifermentans]|uniref:Site-2 protease family protein n=1 Tax=Anaerotignum lactatifermentans TaxID=160404 RepID=A0ABS2G689_9FIRM|nr:site-2 protease family protein [Anaerotignum lactatifermentans]MBM6828157.1 site-2 protease family protein [Anaerotignum lactatifermentans]MBM6876680.1 site-2 protease family protein [Anaerotignum lactatifermentans]MBM6949740.1 site-2 protease family protein [Anaerotignum lactatifermentans]
MDNYLMAFILSIPGLIVAPTLHEFVRALASTALGDDLPKKQGRLTLNPVKHFEPIGFLLLFYSGGFGWGKPVETSGLYYKNRKRDSLIVAILPSVVNLILGMVFLSLTRWTDGVLMQILVYLCYYNVGIAVYNILPVSPMDCVKVLAVVLPANKYFTYLQYEKMIQMIFLFLLFLGFFGGVFQGIIYGIMNFLGQALFIL